MEFGRKDLDAPLCCFNINRNVYRIVFKITKTFTESIKTCLNGKALISRRYVRTHFEYCEYMLMLPLGILHFLKLRVNPT